LPGVLSATFKLHQQWTTTPVETLATFATDIRLVWLDSSLHLETNNRRTLRVSFLRMSILATPDHHVSPALRFCQRV
jgi:hypothetical protein